MNILGIDEAGRGCALGSLVMYGVLVRPEEENYLSKIGVTDSKQFNNQGAELARASIARDIKQLCLWNSRISNSKKIDEYVKAGGLNVLERMMAENIIFQIMTFGIKVDQIDDLQHINTDLRQAWLEKDFLQVTLLNSRFHRIIYQATDNTFLLSYLDNLQNQSQRLAYMCFSKDLSSYDMQSHAELAIKDHQSLIELFRQGSDIEAIEVISEHVKLFQRRVNHFLLPSLDILEAVTPLQGGQNLTWSKEGIDSFEINLEDPDCRLLEKGKRSR